MNGGYQQEYLFRILGEAIDRYPLDGIFFNMIGYQTRDYSRNYHGICQSDACRRRFREWSGGLTLPRKEDPDDPVFRKYDQFRTETSNELFMRVNEFIKGKRPDIAICTYTHAGVDLIRRESGSHIWDERPAFEYHSTDNVKRALGSFPDKQIANTAVHFVDIPYRHSSVAPALTGMRLIENMLNGGSLDFYMIGRLDNQDDRLALDIVKDIFTFHEANERYFTRLQSRAPVLLVRQSSSEFRGLLRILAENHVLFDAMESWLLDSAGTPHPLEDYQLIVLADTANLSDVACERIDAYVKNGGKILATGSTATRDEIGNPRGGFQLEAAGVEPEFEVHEQARGSYFRVRDEDKRALVDPAFARLDILYLRGDFLEFRLRGGARGHLGLIPAAMYGPPEKCYYTEVTDIPGLIVNDYGKGRFAYLPWPVGRHYEHRSHHGHRMLVMAAINHVLGLDREVEVEAPPLIEVTRQVAATGTFEWIGLANHTGQVGTAFYEPIPVRDVVIRMKPRHQVTQARLLRANRLLEVASAGDGEIHVTVPEIGDFEVLLLEYQ